jgi:3-oxoacyl-[acyl-carrier protein] reductase
MRLKGQVAIVTGSGRGLGEPIARAFCREGARVALAARTFSEINTVAEELNAQGHSALAVSTDVGEEGDVRLLFEKTKEAFGEVDILVNNAGTNFAVPFMEVEPDAWDQLIRVNLRGPYLSCREALRVMIPRRSGVILNISSTFGQRPIAGQTAYCASKFALEGFTRSLAMEVETHGIRVNTLHPGGAAQTEIGVETAEGLVALGVIKGGPLLPADILSEPAVFLASEEGAHLTGTCINAREWLAAKSSSPSE